MFDLWSVLLICLPLCCGLSYFCICCYSVCCERIDRCLYSWWLINRVMITVRVLICLKLTRIIIPGISQWDNRAEKHSQLRENEIAFWKWQDWGPCRLNFYQHFLLSLWPFCYQKWRKKNVAALERGAILSVVWHCSDSKTTLSHCCCWSWIMFQPSPIEMTYGKGLKDWACCQNGFRL